MRHLRSLPLAVSSLVAVVTLAACGSTVQVDDPAAQAEQTQQGALGQPGSGLGTPTPGAPGAPGGGGPGTPGSGGPGSVDPGAGSVPGAGAPGAPGVDPGAPVDTDGDGTPDTEDEEDTSSDGFSGDGPIEVGVPYTDNGDAANAAIGAAVSRGDEKAAAEAVIEDINDRGGINGRLLEPVFFAYDAQSSDTPANQDQAACSQFTEDNSVAVVLGGGVTETFDSCMARAGVLNLSSGSLVGPDISYLNKFRNIFALGTLSQDRMMADMAASFGRLNYYSGWSPTLGEAASGAAKLGVLSINIPEQQRPLKSVLLPALARAGHAVDSRNVYAVRSPTSINDIPGTVADVQNAVLRFKTSGVTHVVILDASGTLTLFFTQGANQQRYYPRMGVNSTSGMQALYDTGAIPNDILEGAVGNGWLPIIDVPAAQGKQYATAATNNCLAVIKKRTGQTFTSTNAAGLALSKCDMGYLMEKAFKTIKTPLNLASAIASVEGLGGSYQSPLVPSTFFSKSRHDAVQTGFDLMWDVNCRCAKYVGKHTIR